MMLNELIENTDLTEKDMNVCAMDANGQLHVISVHDIIDFDIDFNVIKTFEGKYDLQALIDYNDFEEIVRRYNARKWS